MNRRKALAIASIGALTLASLPLATATARSAEHAQDPGKVASPHVAVLDFHADWCGKCKQLGPSLKKAEKNLGDEPALFVKLDLTDGRTKKQSEYLMSELGMGDIWTKHGKATGFALVIDAETDRVLSRIEFNSSADEIGSQITGAM